MENRAVSAINAIEGSYESIYSLDFIQWNFLIRSKKYAVATETTYLLCTAN